MSRFKVKIKHPVTDDSGAEKYVADSYIVDAESVVEAEAKLVAVGEFQDYTVEEITKPRIHAMVYDPALEDNKFFRCKVAYDAVEENGKPSVSYIMVQAFDFHDAVARLVEYNKLASYDIEFVQLTPIAGYIA